MDDYLPDDAPPSTAPPFQTSLKLTDLQRKRLLDHVRVRLEECCREMGRGKDGMTAGGSWLDRRRVHQLWYEGDLEWRKSDQYLGGVFIDSNFTRGDGKRYVRHMTAKITDDLLGTSPFFAAMKKDNGDASPRASLMETIEEFAQNGVESSNLPEALREAIELALVRNEAVVKLRNVFDASGFVGPAKVLVGADGQPVLTEGKGLYIFENDNFLSVPGAGVAPAAAPARVGVPAPAGGLAQALPAQGQGGGGSGRAGGSAQGLFAQTPAGGPAAAPVGDSAQGMFAQTRAGGPAAAPVGGLAQGMFAQAQGGGAAAAPVGGLAQGMFAQAQGGGAAAAPVGGLAQGGGPAPGQAAGMFALEKDASFIVTAQERAAFRYQSFDGLPQAQVEREGLEGRVLDPRDFICPLKVNSIHEADICAHFYDESPAVLKQVYGGFDVSQGYFSAPESGEKSPIASQGEQAGGGREQQWVPVGEVYVRFDADEDGREENILLVIDRDRGDGTPLFFDYLHNHMRKRPFEVIHGLRKVPARWYGVGIYADKYDQLIFVDKTFNRINLKNSKACTVTAVRRDAIEEWSDQKIDIALGGNEVLTLNSKWGKDQGEWLEQKRLMEVSQEETELMRNMLQAMDQEFGYISAADASATGLNQSKTATGIASIERSSNTIVKAVERVHTAGIEAVLEQGVDILLENMDPLRLAVSSESELLTLNRAEIRDLPRDVRLLLTRSRSSELLSTNQQATQKANEYFDLMDAKPRRARALRPLYISQLKALEVQDADDLLAEVTDEMIAAVEQSKTPDQPRESTSISLRDIGALAPEERAQGAAHSRDRAASPVEVAAARRAAGAGGSGESGEAMGAMDGKGRGRSAGSDGVIGVGSASAKGPPPVAPVMPGQMSATIPSSAGGGQDASARAAASTNTQPTSPVPDGAGMPAE